MLCCTRKNKFNRNIYITGIIQASMCYTMPLIIPNCLQASDPAATIFNSQEKAYKKDNKFKKSCDLKIMQLVYGHQQKEHIKLMNELQRVSVEYHNLPFHNCISNNTPVHALKTQAHEMLWNQRLIHLSPSNFTVCIQVL